MWILNSPPLEKVEPKQKYLRICFNFFPQGSGAKLPLAPPFLKVELLCLYIV